MRYHSYLTELAIKHRKDLIGKSTFSTTQKDVYDKLMHIVRDTLASVSVTYHGLTNESRGQILSQMIIVSELSSLPRPMDVLRFRFVLHEHAPFCRASDVQTVWRSSALD